MRFIRLLLYSALAMPCAVPAINASTAEAASTGRNQQPTTSPVLVAQKTDEGAYPTQGPLQTSELPPGGSSVEDVLLKKGSITMDEWIQIRAEQEARGADQSRRIDTLEEWKGKTEVLPILRDKVNFGLNALQFLYGHIDAKVPEGRSQDSFSIRRSELLFWGKISETIPRWHILMEFQSINLTNNTPTVGASTPTSATFFRETYIDIRPIQSWAPNLNVFRLGIFRMPFGIFTEQSGGLRDVISSPYLTSVGGGGGPGQNARGTGGAIEFIQERDYFVDVRGKIANRLEYVAGIMNNNNYQANSLVSTTSGLGGANQPKAFYTRVRLFGSDVSFVSFTTIQGTSNNAGTLINGRGKGAFDRYGVDFRYTSKILPGFMVQGEWWQGHDGANATTVGTAANGACQVTTQCGGSGAPGMQRRTYYVLGKYLISQGPLQNFEPTVMWEQFDPNTSMSNDLYTRTIVGLTYYFENFPPKVQSKLQFNYEFRHHQGLGTGPGTPAYDASTDPFANNAFFVQFQVRFM
ncbi:hypothetical protein W02_34880 [Nitrospira sp. KM1]|uniref:hypothetical protein n=1 Tax=Nitrospira sp. KM1 TaxID=1936990 RepID=UPI0013A71801|nr:hypothetical protein [Nitrospira sp. KM1]BCA56348.1 hypothetical protein W02_34880 [Nitrospira sp. KM1]